MFRLGGLGENRKVEVRFTKESYSPQLFMKQPTGTPNWVVALWNRTYFEGVVRGPDGKSVANAHLRANQGPKRAEGVVITEIWTEARTDTDGRFRMYVQPDKYDIQVRSPNGVARLPRTTIIVDEAKRLDIQLEAGVRFRAKTVDSERGKPVAAVRLWHWQHPGVEGRSGDDGTLEIVGMFPGKFEFRVEADGYTRWWSDDAVSEWNRRQKIDRLGGWQRNFDHLDFDLASDMKPVTIMLERGVRISGRVLDPDGNPVAGATVAPALTGTGNSLTGDTRFSVASRDDGTFEMLLPASGERDYNLVVHDGKFQEWRRWANGVLPPIRTKPGQELRNVTLDLTRPATVRGRVTDAAGQPVARRQVRAAAADKRENRYYDPTTETDDDGYFELRFVRPGKQLIQVAPFWLDPEEAPAGTSQTVNVDAGEVRTDVDLKVPKE
jgi:hypothetical protein